MSLLDMNHISSTDIFVFVIINGSKHVRTWAKSWLVIKILQGSAVTQTMLGGLTILQISCSVHVPKIMKIGWQ